MIPRVETLRREAAILFWACNGSRIICLGTQETRVRSCWEDPWRRDRPSLALRISVDCIVHASHKESDTTEDFHIH